MTTQRENLRNIAIIAHVDHGKTTLVDQLLRQSGTLDARAEVSDRMMDSNDLERERGITILSKNTAINWHYEQDKQDYRINIVDTPGHADFGGEVERILSMVDSVLLLVDAVEGPMPQTRFVTQKAFAMGFTPIVVINKIDRDGARPDWVIDQVFDLFDKLGATDEQLDFPVIYASALNGYASNSDQDRSGDMIPLFEAIVEYVNPPQVEIDGPFQLQVSSLDYDSYKGVLGIGRITRGQISRNTAIKIVGADGKFRDGRMMQLFGFDGLQRVDLARRPGHRVHRVAHRGEVHHRRNAGEVLQQHPPRHERDLDRRLGLRIPFGHRLDVLGRDDDAVLTAEEVLEENARREG